MVKILFRFMNSFPKIKIGGKLISDGSPCFIIAEIGSNHNRDFFQAKKMIDIAKWAGADAVKFQHFSAERIYPKKSGSVQYLKQLGIKKSIFNMIKGLEIPPKWTPKLAKHCEKKGIIFLSTPFSEEDADSINPYVPAFKIASYELTHIPLIKYIARKGKPLIISTGAATGLNEIREAVKAAKSVGNKRICLMQCTAKYPAPIETVNTRVIQTLKKEFHVPVGLSDHSSHHLYGAGAAIAAGANLYEKHFTINRKMEGPDHSFALEPEELKNCISLIRNIEKAMGTGEKKFQGVEKELSNYRRCVYTVKDIKKGDTFTDKNTKILRKPGVAKKGIFPSDYDTILGKKAGKNLPAFTLLEKKDII